MYISHIVHNNGIDNDKVEQILFLEGKYHKNVEKERFIFFQDVFEMVLNNKLYFHI